MAVAFDAASTAAATSGGLTLSHTTAGSDRVLVVFVDFHTAGGTKSVSGITYNGVALTFREFATWTANVRQELWTLVAPASGAHDIVVTLSASSEHYLSGLSFTGAHQTTPLGTIAKAEETGSSIPQVTVASAVDELVAAGLSSSSSGGTLQVPATERTAPAASNWFQRSSTSPGAAPTVLTLYGSTSTWGMLGVSLKPAGAGPITGALALMLGALTIVATGIVPQGAGRIFHSRVIG